MSMTDDTLNSLIALRNRMQADASAETRTDAAQHLATLFSAGALDAPERQIALAIFEKLAKDVERQVRQTLALQVASCPDLPAALARTIAADEEAVSLPFLRLSPALVDDDLLAVIATGGAAKQIAIASRPSVSEAVSGALVATHDVEVVAAVLENEGAAVGEASYHEIVDHFAADNLVQGLLVAQPSLPLAVTERLAVALFLRSGLGLPDVERVALAGLHAVPRLGDLHARGGSLRMRRWAFRPAGGRVLEVQRPEDEVHVVTAHVAEGAAAKIPPASPLAREVGRVIRPVR